MSHNNRILQTILDREVIAVIREGDPDHVAPLIDALSRSGITTIEITLTTPDALALIVEHAKRDDLLIGAGSVLTASQAEQAFAAGALFYASPCYDPDALAIAKRADRIALPGGLTPNEILSAWRNGADIVKMFPVPADGAAYLRSVRAPMPEVRIAPSGGITAENAADFLRAGAAALNVGSWLTPQRENLEERLRVVEQRGALLCRAVADAKER